MFVEARISDPKSIDRRRVAEILDSGRTPTIQFSEADYRPGLLRDVNLLCAEFGERIEVRFFGHYSSRFDADALRDLPDAQWLSIDCLHHIANAQRIADLPKLTRLSFGVFEFDEPDFLATIGADRLTRLSVGETRKRNFDLAPLANCDRLTHLFVHGHTKHINTIGALPRLARLSLSACPKHQNLAFLSDAPALQSLRLLFGGRETIDEFSHPRLKQLAVIRVRGLETVGDLERFPNLRILQIEDQLQLRAIDLQGPPLERVWLFNCKNLASLKGIEHTTRLRELRASIGALTPDALLSTNWPVSLEAMALFTASRKRNAAIRAELDRRGYVDNLGILPDDD